MTNIGWSAQTMVMNARIYDPHTCINGFDAAIHYVDSTMAANYWYRRAANLPTSSEQGAIYYARGSKYDVISRDGYKRLPEGIVRDTAERIGSETYTRQYTNGMHDYTDFRHLINPERCEAERIQKMAAHFLEALQDDLYQLYEGTI